MKNGMARFQELFQPLHQEFDPFEAYGIGKKKKAVAQDYQVGATAFLNYTAHGHKLRLFMLRKPQSVTVLSTDYQP